MNAVVLGIGNPLLGDDGFGVEVARQLQTNHARDFDDIEIVDGGSQGLYLLPYLQGRTHVIVSMSVTSKPRNVSSSVSAGCAASG